MNEISKTEIKQSTTQAQPKALVMLQLLLNRPRFLFMSFMTGFVFSAIVAFSIPKEYKSTAQLMPPDPQATSLISLATLSGSTAMQIPSAASTLLGRSPDGLFIGILSSRTAKDDLINRFNLLQVYHVKEYWAARKILETRTVIEEDRKTGNLTISVTDSDPSRARALTAAYISELNSLTVQMSTSSARRERIFLEDRLKLVKQDLDSATQQLSVFSSRSGTLAPDTQGKVELDAISKVQADLISSEGELHGLEASFGPENVRVQSLQARISELKKQLQKMTGSRNENSVTSEDGEFLPSIRALPFLGTTYSDLYRRVTLEEALYSLLSKQYEIAKVEEEKEIPTVRVLDPPDFPERKSFPPRAEIIIFGAIMGLILGVCGVLGPAFWNDIDDGDPYKSQLKVIFAPFREKLPWPTRLRAASRQD